MDDKDQITAAAALHRARTLAAGPAVVVVSALRDPIGDEATADLLVGLAKVLSSQQVVEGRQARTRLQDRDE